MFIKIYWTEKTNMESKLEVGDLAITADKRKIIFCQGVTTKWSCILYTITEFIDYPVPSYHINNSPEMKHSITKNSELRIQVKEEVMTKNRVLLNQIVIVHHYQLITFCLLKEQKNNNLLHLEQVV